MNMKHLSAVAAVALFACGSAFAQSTDNTARTLANPRAQAGDRIANECKDQLHLTGKDYIDCDAQWRNAKDDAERQQIVTRYRTAAPPATTATTSVATTDTRPSDPAHESLYQNGVPGNDAARKLANPRAQAGDKIANECKDQLHLTGKDYIDCDAQWRSAKDDAERERIIVRYRK